MNLKRKLMFNHDRFIFHMKIVIAVSFVLGIITILAPIKAWRA